MTNGYRYAIDVKIQGEVWNLNNVNLSKPSCIKAISKFVKKGWSILSNVIKSLNQWYMKIVKVNKQAGAEL